MTTKQITIAFAVLVLIAFGIGLARDSKPAVVIPEIPVAAVPIDLCYYRNDKTASGLYDRAWIRLSITGTQVTGEFRNVPAEKDSKVGDFVGTVAPLDQERMARTATVIWDTRAEGMQAKEELLISFGEGSAQAAFGEMVQGANGVYVYKDKTAAVYQKQLSQIDCEALDEIVAVETHIRNTDLKTLTKDSPVLGGTLRIVSVVTSPTTDSAVISYEDGHIAGSGTVSYTYDRVSGTTTIVGFVKAK